MPLGTLDMKVIKTKNNCLTIKNVYIFVYNELESSRITNENKPSIIFQKEKKIYINVFNFNIDTNLFNIVTGRSFCYLTQEGSNVADIENNRTEEDRSKSTIFNYNRK